MKERGRERESEGKTGRNGGQAKYRMLQLLGRKGGDFVNFLKP